MASLYLSIPNYPDPQAPGTTFTAFGKITSLTGDFIRQTGRFTIGIYRTEAAMNANAEPVDTLIIQAGGRILKGGPQRGPIFADMVTIQTANIQAWGALWQYLLTGVIALDGLTGATVRQTA